MIKMLAGRKIYLLNCVRVNDLILQELLNSFSLPVWLCSATKRISPAFFFQLASTQQGFTLQVFVAPSLWCVLDCPVSHVCVRSKAVQLLWCLLCPPVWSFGAGSRKERDLVMWLRASPALWLQELLIHVQLCVKWIRDRVNQSTQGIYLLQVSEMCEEKV